MVFRRAAVAGLAFAAAALLHAADVWQISFFHDKPEQNFDIADIQCPSAGHCVAAGAIEEADKFNPYGVTTSDAGAHWTPLRLSELPISLFFHDANTGWMVTAKAVWQTRDGGQSWKKLRSMRDVRRVFFLDENHGFAVCDDGKLLETTNGGSAWKEIESVHAALGNEASQVTLEWIFFRDARDGIVVGEMTPAGANRVPAWLEPPRSRSARAANDVVKIGRTADGGVTWTFSSIPRTDDLINVIFRPPEDLWFIFQPAGAESRSTIERCAWNSNELTVVLRDTDALLADATQAANIHVASIPRQGRLLNLPVPGKLRIYSGPDFEHLERAEVDYRAIARRAQFATAPGGDVFLATDTGMILKLAHKP